MSRILIILIALLLGLMVAGVLILGAFPPKAHRAPVEHVLSNDKFPSH